MYDCTIDRELAQRPGWLPFPGVYHLWSRWDRQRLDDSQRWAEALDLVRREPRIWLDIEPDTSARPEWRAPVDPSMAPLAEVRETHRLIAEKLDPLCKEAREHGCQVWLYRMLSLSHARGGHIVGEGFAQWRRNMETVCELECWRGKSLAELVGSTGGGEIFEVYVPSGWNIDASWGMAKQLTMIERMATELDRNDVRAMPLLSPWAIGGERFTPLRIEIVKALRWWMHARYGDQWGVWNGPLTDDDGAPHWPAVPSEIREALA